MYVMSETMGKTRHAIDYVELTVSDLAAAKTFYGKAFGWTFNDYGPAYAGFIHPGRAGEAGGFHQDAAATAATGSAPLVLLFSDALEESLAAVRWAGGAVTKEIFAFPGGRRFHFSDPSGNELGVWSES